MLANKADGRCPNAGNIRSVCHDQENLDQSRWMQSEYVVRSHFDVLVMDLKSWINDLDPGLSRLLIDRFFEVLEQNIIYFTEF